MPELDPAGPTVAGPAHANGVAAPGNGHDSSLASGLRRELLTELRRGGPASPDQLALRLGASRTGVVQQLRALEAAAL
ncbi:MAG TPA: helix-turn-helix domain-containing protein, partial [Candidatus Limnocylindrales bacterium]